MTIVCSSIRYHIASCTDGWPTVITLEKEVRMRCINSVARYDTISDPACLEEGQAKSDILSLHLC